MSRVNITFAYDIHHQPNYYLEVTVETNDCKQIHLIPLDAENTFWNIPFCYTGKMFSNDEVVEALINAPALANLKRQGLMKADARKA